MYYEAFTELYKFKKGFIKKISGKIINIFSEYVTECEKLADYIDKFKV